MGEQVLLARPVLHGELVGPLRLVRLASQHHARLVAGQPIRHRVLRVRRQPDDHRPVGIAVLVGHHGLHADARDHLGAPRAAGPGLADPHPHRVRPVPLRPAVPGKAQLHPAIGVGVDLLPRRPGDDGDLHAVDAGLGRVAVRRGRHAGGRGLETVGVARGGSFAVLGVGGVGGVACVVGDLGRDVRLVGLLRVGDLVGGEAPGGHQRADAALAHDLVVIGFGRLHAVAHGALARVVLHEAAGILVQLVLGPGGAACDLAAHVAAALALGDLARRLEVPIPPGALAGDEGVRAVEREDVVAVRQAAGHAQPGLRLQVLVGALVVGQMHRVLALDVLEPVERSILFEPTVEVGKVRLVPLHAIVARGRRRRADHAGRVGRRQPVLGQHHLANLGAGLGQEDAAIGAPGQQPQLRAQDERVLAHGAGHHVALPQGDAQQVPGAHLLAAAFPVGKVERDVHQPAHQVRRLQVRALGADDGAELEQLADLFLALEPLKQQHVLAERRVDPQQAAGLRVGGTVGHGRLALG